MTKHVCLPSQGEPFGDVGLSHSVEKLDDRLPLTPAGYYQSEVFPGLWLDPAALASGDLAKVLQVLQQGFQIHDRVLRPASVIVSA